MSATSIPAPSALPRLLRAPEVAEALGLSTANLYAHVERGNLPFEPVRIGTAMRFREHDVLAFINGEGVSHA